MKWFGRAKAREFDRGYRAGAAQSAAPSDVYKTWALEMEARITALAEEHGKPYLGDSPLSVRGKGKTKDGGWARGTQFYCSSCSSQWPCRTFQWATDRKFEPLHLIERLDEGDDQ